MPRPTPNTPPAPQPADAPRSRRGFASMDPERLRAVSSKGGKAPHEAGPRGFARMDPERLRAVALQGSQARHPSTALPPPSPWPATQDETVPQSPQELP